GKKIWATLFGRYCDQFCTFVQEHLELTHFTLIIQLGRISTYEGSYSVSNAFNGTKLFFNDDKVKEIVEFRDKFLETWDEQSSSSFSSLSKCVAYNMEKDFIEDTNYSFTAEVDSVNKIKDLIVVGTIVFIEPRWFYMACNHCTKIVQPSEEGDEVSYHCSDDVCIKEKRVINPYPRFKMMFKVQDSAGTVDMTMFEGCAKQILKKTATDFFPKPISKAAAIVQAIPKELQDLIDKKFAFKIAVTEFNIKNRYRYYKVVKVTEDPTIILALEKKHHHDQVLYLEGSNTTLKDCLGVSTTEVTPDSVNMPQKVLDYQTEADGLKRNLSEVYDGDDLSITSSSKTRSTESGNCSVSRCDDQEELQGKLIIPKLEK
ncbi:hypothetical protein SSX86_031629, partial [Deinandra increscens subsp. villosa]